MPCPHTTRESKIPPASPTLHPVVSRKLIHREVPGCYANGCGSKQLAALDVARRIADDDDVFARERPTRAVGDAIHGELWKMIPLLSIAGERPEREVDAQVDLRQLEVGHLLHVSG